MNKTNAISSVFTIDQMKEVESNTFNKLKIPESLIIENVGINCGKYIENNILNIVKDIVPRVLIIIGKGNNGADGVAIARYLFNQGIDVTILSLFSQKEFSRELNRQFDYAVKYGLKIVTKTSEIDFNKNNFTSIIDSILGTGFIPPLSDSLSEVIGLINNNSNNCPVISIDIPSGLSGDGGELRVHESQEELVAVKASHTLAISKIKVGHLINKGPQYCNELVEIDVGFPQKVLNASICKCNRYLINKIPFPLKSPSDFSYKNKLGHILFIGGSHGLTGAVAISSLAALNLGAGLVTILTYKDCYPELIEKLQCPDIMTGIISDELLSVEALSKFQSIVIGPGLGIATDLILKVVKNFNGNIIIDADGINSLTYEQCKEISSERVIITPHPGEMSRLLGVSIETLLKDQVSLLDNFIKKFRLNVVLKGSTTQIQLSNLDSYFLNKANSALAKAGSGDILAGIIGALSLTYSVKEAVTIGVYIHSQVGQKAKNYLNIFSTPSKLIALIPDVLKDLL